VVVLEYPDDRAPVLNVGLLNREAARAAAAPGRAERGALRLRRLTLSTGARSSGHFRTTMSSSSGVRARVWSSPPTRRVRHTAVNALTLFLLPPAPHRRRCAVCMPHGAVVPFAVRRGTQHSKVCAAGPPACCKYR